MLSKFQFGLTLLLDYDYLHFRLDSNNIYLVYLYIYEKDVLPFLTLYTITCLQSCI